MTIEKIVTKQNKKQGDLRQVFSLLHTTSNPPSLLLLKSTEINTLQTSSFVS